MKALFRRIPGPTLVALLLLPFLLLIDTLCYQVALPVTITIQQGKGSIVAGGTHLALGNLGQTPTLQFAPHDPLVHEYQLDGSDSTNNLNLDTTYLSQISSSFYYRLQAWMRDLDGTSRWRNLEIQANGQTIKREAWPEDGSAITLPRASTITIKLQLQRPETPMSLNFLLKDGQALQVTIDRNNRLLSVTDPNSDLILNSAFFPFSVAPFAVMIIDTLARILLWAIGVLLVVQASEAGLGLARAAWGKKKGALLPQTGGRDQNEETEHDQGSDISILNASECHDTFEQTHTDAPVAATDELSITEQAQGQNRHNLTAHPVTDPYEHRPDAHNLTAHLTGQAYKPQQAEQGAEEDDEFSEDDYDDEMEDDEDDYNDGMDADESEEEISQGRRPFPLFQALHPIALVALGCSLIAVIWIALIEFQGEPHIYDASAYLFAARMYASGQLSVPAPALSQFFPGPFMVIWNGRWFGQYDPGTSLTLVPGVWLGVPWIIEPLMGTLALLGIGLIAARLYNRRVATLAVLLGCLSPFYSFLAASYLSHAIALCYLVWGFWALLRFCQGGGGWSLALSAFGFSMAALTRDQVALLYIGILLPGVIIITWKRQRPARPRLSMIAWGLITGAIALFFTEVYLGFNLILTGSPLLTPRNLFSPADHWGFGLNVGFYGQHTLAAGLVNLDELLTSLQIDLFGWPFYLTLIFLIFPFLPGRARKADWFLLLALIITAGSYIGYFYHGIYLGPRYLFEDLPFLLILTSRGILSLGTWGIERGQGAFRWLNNRMNNVREARRPAVSLVTLLLVGGLILCNLIYYTPRQIERYQNYNGLSNKYNLDTSQLYHTNLHNAIVLTEDLTVYQMVLFPLNDPELKDSVLYAWLGDPSGLEILYKAFPGRSFYLLAINTDGSIQYVPLHP